MKKTELERTQEELRYEEAIKFKAGLLNVSLEEAEKWIRENVSGKFRPCAFYTPALRDVRVIRKDCSYTAKWVSRWSDVHIDTHCPWWKFWGRYVGFEVYCPNKLGLLKDCAMIIIPVTLLLDLVLQEDPKAFGKYKLLCYWLARGLDVKIYKEEEGK